MNRRRILNQACGFILAFVLAVGCSQTNQQTELTISAAASLTDAMNAIQPIYEQENPEVKLTYNLASSGSLQQQIEQGAPVDVFISAAPKQMNALEEKQLLLSGTRQDLLKNEMVLIVPKEENQVKNFEDLTTELVEKIAVGEPESVPAGKYAQEVLTSLNLLETVQPKEIYAKDVRQVLTYVESGNVDAGIVYSSDAKISDKVKIVATAPAESHSPIIYPVAVIQSSKNPEVAKDFIQFLDREQAKAVFEQYGFGIVEP